MNWLYFALWLSATLFFCCFTVAFYFYVTRDTDLYRRRVEERLQALIQERGAAVSKRDIQLLKEELLSGIPFLHRALIRFEAVNRLQELLRQAELKIVVNK